MMKSRGYVIAGNAITYNRVYIIVMRLLIIAYNFYIILYLINIYGS